MTSSLKEDIPIGLYRTVDDVTNLKIRLCIRKTVAVSTSVLEENNLESDENESLGLPKAKKFSGSERTFSWQEKVPKDEKTTNINIASTSEDTEENIPLFSYVNAELSLLDSENKQMWITVRHLKVESKEMAAGKKTFYSDEVKTYQKPFCFKELVQKSSRKVPSHVIGQSMAIMALLDVNDSSDAEEVQLCHLTYDGCGVLTVIPDFNVMPYYIRSSKSETYEFILEHASNSITSSDAEQEKTFLEKVYQHHSDSVASLLGGDFEMPNGKTKLCSMMGELVSAENFDADNLFIRYSFELPSNATAVDEDSLFGITNFCKVKKKTNDNGTVAYFGLPFNLSFETEHVSEINQVRMIIEVSSIDVWNVCRNEGYGYCVLSTSPGHQSIEIKTWKLFPQTTLERLKNFFIGGTPYLEDMSYTRIPTSFQDAQLSKYGVKTETSGSVHLTSHTLLQSS